MHAILAGAVEEVLDAVGRLHLPAQLGLPAGEAHLDAGLWEDVEAVRERRHRDERAARRLAAEIIEEASSRLKSAERNPSLAAW